MSTTFRRAPGTALTAFARRHELVGFFAPAYACSVVGLVLVPARSRQR
jgi:hypothetical protein